MKNILIFIWELVKIIVITSLIVIPIRYFIFQPFFVKGSSMEPNFSNGDYLIVDELSYRFRQPKRGEVIVFRYPKNPSQRYIKRIIGLPGETIEFKESQILIYDKNGRKKILEESNYLPIYYPEFFEEKKISLGPNEYYVLGDNRASSFDSRRWGVLPRKNIIGRVVFRAWPLAAMAKVEAPAY